MSRCVQLSLNGFEVWAFVVKMEDGYQIRLSLDEWYASRLSEGRRVTVRIPGKPDTMLFITEATSKPPVVWLRMLKRVTAMK